MLVSDKIYHILSKRVSTAYLFSGGSIMSLIDKFKHNKIKYYIPTSEASGGFCSIGHNKSLNRLDSVIITTSGPGLTNVITPLTDAYCDRVPLLVISGDVSTNMQGKNAFQEAPAIKLTNPITHFNHTINKDDNIEKTPTIINRQRNDHTFLDFNIKTFDLPNSKRTSKRASKIASKIASKRASKKTSKRGSKRASKRASKKISKEDGSKRISKRASKKTSKKTSKRTSKKQVKKGW